MGKEKFINGYHDGANHDGRRSAVRRVQSAMDQMKAWRQERTTAHEAGKQAELCYPGEIGHLPKELEEGLVGGFEEPAEYPEITHDVWLDTVAGENIIYRSATLGEEGDEVPAEERT